MQCPYCSHEETRVVDSRPSGGGTSIRRRRECARCGARFTTYERAAVALVVRKRGGRREAFDPGKVRRGIEAALADRPVSGRAVDDIVADVAEIASEAGTEVSADEIGREVLARLRELDEVAYLRFASVYKEFAGASDFEREVAALEADG